MINYSTKTIFILLIGLFLSIKSPAQYFGLSEQNRFNALMESIEGNHVQYHSLSDSINLRFRKNLVRNLDPSGRILKQDDEEVINCLLEEISVDQWDLSATVMDTCYLRYRNRVYSIIKFLESLDPVDFSERDSIILVPYSEKLIYAKTESEFLKRWKRNLKYSALLSTLSDTLSHLSNEEIMESLAEKWREEVENSICELRNLILQPGDLKQRIFNNHLSTYAQCFDPHTDYFSLTDNEIFNASLNSQFFSPGFFVQPDGSDYFISELSPSITVKYSEIHIGDEIVSISKDNNFISPACVSEKEMYTFFYGEADTTIHLKIKCPKDRITREYEFVKSLTDNSNNTSLGYLLKTDKITAGYLSMPSFYAIQDGVGTSSGNDLAELIMDMKNNDPDAIILDLRSNGGGSIEEAINLSGLFIDFGPLFLTRDKFSSEPFLIKDTKKGQLHKGKLVILVNEYSASASELVATALQTYPNVLIVGSNTFGKSSGQEVFPLYDNYEVFGYAKITTNEIFRFDGQTIQLKGVSPDIVIPSGLPSKWQSESKLDFALQFDKSSKQIKPIFKRNVPVETLRILANKRINQSPSLTYLAQLETKMNQILEEEMIINLKYDEFDWPLSGIKEVSDTSALIQVEPVLNKLLLDSVTNIYYNQIIRTDPTLNETMRIIEDWMSLTSTN